MFSIIVPVHNVEDYIDECIKSIIMQSYRKFELILVVNASVDESYNICKDWEMKDDRVLVIHTDISEFPMLEISELRRVKENG